MSDTRVKILHVEDNKIVANAVQDTLEMEGWSVEVCEDGAAAHRQIAGNTHYDLLLFDNELPGVRGVDLIRHTRDFPHRWRTLIIMLSASDCEAEARRAGANAFLRKPGDMKVLVETITQLLKIGTRRD